MLMSIRDRWTVTKWFFLKKWNIKRGYTKEEIEVLTKAYNNALKMFESLGIDIAAKQDHERRLYFVVLQYIDEDEVIAPAYVRTATLIGFLETTDAGWSLPPTTVALTKEARKQIDGYFAMEVFRNYSGIEDIYKELKEAINRTAASIKGETKENSTAGL